MTWVLCAGALAIPLAFVPIGADVFVGPKTVTMVAATVALVICLALLAAAGRLRGRAAILDVLAAYLVLWVAATVLSPDPAHSLLGEPRQYQGLVATIAYAIAFVAGWCVLGDERALRRFCLAIVIAGAVATAYALTQAVGADPIWRGELDRGRVFSTLGQANALAAFLVIAIPLGAAETRRRTGLGRWAGAAVTLGMTAVVVLSLSRGAYLGLIAAAAAAMVLAAARRFGASRDHARGPRPGSAAGRDDRAVRPSARARSALPAAIGVILVTGIALVVLVTPGSPVARRLSVALDPAEGSAASHLDTWAVGVRIALDRPLLGIGPEMYPNAFAAYRDEVLPPARAEVLARFRPESPHSVPIAIADAAGLIALALYIALLGLAVAAGVQRCRRAGREDALLIGAVLAAIAGHLVTDLFMTAEPAGSWVFWVLLGSMAVRPSLRGGPVSWTRGR